MAYPEEQQSDEDSALLETTEIFLLAGGKGTRLRVRGDKMLDRPKLLVKVATEYGTMPMVNYAISRLIDTGLNRFTFLTTTNQDARGQEVEEHIKEYFELQNEKSFDISFSIEDQPLGTAGAAFCGMRKTTAKQALITPGDTLFPFHLVPSILASHKARNADITWVVTSNPGNDAQNAGKIIVDNSNGNIAHILEGTCLDPTEFITDQLRGFTSVGVIIVKPSFFINQILAYILEYGIKPIDLYREFIPWLLDIGYTVNTFDIQQPAPDLGTVSRWMHYAPVATHKRRRSFKKSVS